MRSPGLDAGGRASQNLSIFRIISPSLANCAAVRGRPGAEIQNLSESIRLAVFDHVRPCILIVHRASCANFLYDPWDLSLFGWERGYSLERADPGRRA